MNRTHHPRSAFGERKAALFNERFPIGDLVAVRRAPGEPATWDRVFAPAYGAGDGAMVELASSLVPVDTDLIFAFEPATMDRGDHGELQAALPARCQEPRRLKAWVIACAYLLGFASAVVLALVQPVRATTPAVHTPEITSDAGETV